MELTTHPYGQCLKFAAAKLALQFLKNPIIMAPSKGNKYWMRRETHGRPQIFATGEKLWQAACDYFAWNEENPLYEEKLFAFQGIVTRDRVAKMRAMTIDGLCQHIGINPSGYRAWRHNRPDLVDTIESIDSVIRRQKFEGAAAELLSPLIIARDLGLSDKTEITGRDGKDLLPPADDVETARRVAFILARGMAAASPEKE